MKALIVDDERHARQLIRAILTDMCPDVTIVGEAEDLAECVKLVHKHQPDLLLLDIEMPGHSGLEILDFFDADDINFHIVFTTAYSEYAVKAFEVSAVDYLLKPLEAESVKKAIDKVAKRLQRKDVIDYGQLTRALGQQSPAQRMAIPDGHELIFIDTNDILYFDAEGAYTHVFLKNNKKITTTKKLKFFEDRLQSHPSFVRIHRGYLVNMNHLVKYTRADGSLVEMSNGTMLPVSREKNAFLLEKMEAL
ncbi:MAG: DNA-binding response regulator [Bacteroidetes bacterium]|nr:MAG: DNA-binding response regulator [Bacteroidota bacterium]